MRNWGLRPPARELLLSRDKRLCTVLGQCKQQQMASAKTLEGWVTIYCETFLRCGSSGGRRDELRVSKGHKFCQASGQGLWPENRFNSALLPFKLNSWQLDANGGSMRAYFGSSAVEEGMVSSGAHGSVEQLWHKYFKDPAEWWDNRNNKHHPKSPDFRHKTSKDGLWIDSWSTPQWVAEWLEKSAASRNSEGGSLESGSSIHVKRHLGSATDLKRPQRDEFYWTAKISQHTKCGQGRHALQAFKDMKEDGVKPSSYTYVAALKACSSLRDLESAKQIYAEVIQFGFATDVYVGNMMVDVYAKCRSLVDARDIFEKMPHRDVVSWNAMILGYAQMEEGKEALELYAQMQLKGVLPDARTVVGALKACSSLVAFQEGERGDRKCVKKWCLEQVRDIHSYIVKKGYDSAVFVGTMLVDVYAKCGSLVDARRVFNSMPHRNVVSWTAMILGYAQMEHGKEALQLFAQMQQEGVVPNDRTYVAALKACNSLAALDEGGEAGRLLLKKGCLEQVRAIHSQMVKSGYESSVFVDTMLVDVYAKCETLVDARQIFDKMPHRDVVSWNAMILGYAQMNEGEKALDLYAQMQQEGVIPNARAFVAALKACSSLATVEEGTEADGVWKKCLEQVRVIHADILKSGCLLDVFVGTMLVDTYAKCGNLVSARQVFEAIRHRDVVCWNAMILGYAQIEDGEEALRLYSRMQQEGVEPDDRTLVGALKACSSLAALEGRNSCDADFVRSQSLQKVRSIHADIVKSRTKSDVFVENMLVDVYAKCGSLVEARQVFEMMPHHNVVSWTALVLGYAQMGEGEEALQLFARMKLEGVVPNDRTFVAALKACSSIFERREGDGILGKEQCLEHVRTIYSDVLSSGYDSDVFVGTMLVDVYAKSGSLVDARHVFEKMPHRNVVSWTAMIMGYAQREGGEKALELYARMQQEGVAPDERTFVAALKACSSLVTSQEGNEAEVAPLKQRCLDTVRSIHSDIVRCGAGSGLFVGNMLVDAYAKCGSLVDARQVFEEMPDHNVVSWNAMILGYAQVEEGFEALHLYDRMQQEGVDPDDRTFVCALQACGSVAGLEKGKEIHGEISRTGLDTTGSFVSTALVDMYAKCGRMDAAQQVFDALAIRCPVTWNALIAGYARQGQSVLVFDLFKKMRQEGSQPDSITLLTLLTVCSHVGLVDQGQMYFHAMSSDYGIKPTVEHFNCMVDLLGRAGELEKALQLATIMPFQTPGKVWRSILAACQKWGNVELGRQAFECAVRLERTDAAAYVLMANIYSAAHMEEQAKEIQAMRVNSHAWKKPGQSWWIDVGGEVHTFAVGRRR